ncbi:hypothetical protein E2C01_054411 [Portunus trituberculatus]|uniref:Uncharacterized protein n=1 Tax=Portunus trituberculatus TaxID=210409 RepID=A0A5B7GT46_PORTR|nr:hypothetical protein [Portunus trituberculatus]
MVLIYYTRNALLRLRKGSGYPDSSVIVKLKSLGLFRNRGKKKNRHASKHDEKKKEGRGETQKSLDHHGKDTHIEDHDEDHVASSPPLPPSSRSPPLPPSSRSSCSPPSPLSSRSPPSPPSPQQGLASRTRRPSITDYIPPRHPPRDLLAGKREGVAPSCPPPSPTTHLHALPTSSPRHRGHRNTLLPPPSLTPDSLHYLPRVPPPTARPQKRLPESPDPHLTPAHATLLLLMWACHQASH